VDGTVLGSCLMAVFLINGFKSLGYITRELVGWLVG
jgi:hypothetical protein